MARYVYYEDDGKRKSKESHTTSQQWRSEWTVFLPNGAQIGQSLAAPMANSKRAFEGQLLKVEKAPSSNWLTVTVLHERPL